MLEIKVTYFPPVGSYNGASCISKGIPMLQLVNERTEFPGNVARELVRILYENCEEFKIEFDDMQATRASRMSVELSQSSVSNQLNEKNDASDAVLFPFYVTYGAGSNLGNRYSIVLAESHEEAQKQVKSICGNKYCAIYNKKEFGNQAEQYNLTLVALQPQQMRSR